MTLQDTMEALESLGTDQNRKVYERHGVTVAQYGVSVANLKTLKKQIKIDHVLAQQLWATGNHDARALATLIADPKQTEGALLDSWAADLDNYILADSFSGFVSRTPLAHEKMEAWTQVDKEWIGQAGWNLLAHLAMSKDAAPDTFFEPYLSVIEKNVHAARNRVRYAMNNALIAIGTRSDALEQRAVDVARQIGTVEVDHGETGCKTPDAADYIKKARVHRGEKEQSA